jgi:hypothetical protein
MLTISAAIALLYAFESYTSIFIVNIKYKSASEYSPLKASMFSVLALGTILSSFFSGECLLDSPCEGDITYYTAGLKAYKSTSDGDT